MIIQHPDGSYEICPLAPAIARRARALLRQLQAASDAIHSWLRGASAGGAAACGDGGHC